MWRRIYLLLALLRLYFAVSPSYLHPDEHFQGPEVITGASLPNSLPTVGINLTRWTGHIFSYPTHLTWEFTAANPIRSVFPLWLIYGWPLTVLRWIWEGFDYGTVPPAVAFYTLRVLMFMLSFVLEDWALHELLPIPRERRTATMLVASSYVTWTFQTHTFSNSIETLAVLWSLVLAGRIKEDKVGIHVSDRHESLLTVLTEELSSGSICCPGLPCRIRYLQQNYISCIPLDTRSTTPAAFPTEVSLVRLRPRLP